MWLPSPQRSIPNTLQRGAIEPEEAFLVERFWCELNQVQGESQALAHPAVLSEAPCD